MTTNRNKRKNAKLRYLRQCVKDLEHIALALARQLGRHDIPVPLVDPPLDGETLLTPYNSGFSYGLRLQGEADVARRINRG